MADNLTKKQRKELSEFAEGGSTAIVGGAAETGLSAAMSGAAMGAKLGTALGPGVGTAIGAGAGLVIGGLIGGWKSWKQHEAMTAAQKREMTQANRAGAEQSRQALRERGKAGAEMQRAYQSTPEEMSGSPVGSGVSSYDAYKARNYGG